MASHRDQNIVWLDMEMTGLDPIRDTIIEIATVVTDSQLHIMAEGPEIIVYQPNSLYQGMDDWNKQHHKNSGLWEKVIHSQVSLSQAETMTLDFLKPYIEPKKNLIAGNSIWQDRRFIIQHMPLLDKIFNYRMIDVSSIKSLCTYWYPNLKFSKKGAHRALDDIKESIEELRFYRSWAFNPNAVNTAVHIHSSLMADRA